MKQILFIVVLIFLARTTQAQQIPAYYANDLLQRVNTGDTVYIINFWATWCVPCVQELPEFNVLQKRYAGKPVKILLVSLDFKEDYPYKLGSFLERKHIAPEVVWFKETNPDVYIPKIEKSWEGSIPATLIIDHSNSEHSKIFRKFIEGTITAEQISGIVDRLLSN